MQHWFEDIHGWMAYLLGEAGETDVFIQCALALAVAFTVWLVAKRVLIIAERRLSAHPIVEAKPRIFIIARTWLQYTVVLAAGTFFTHLFKIQVIENAFIAAIIIGLAFPLKEFLSILLDYLHGKTVAKTETRVDDILFELLDRFAGVIIFSVAVILALDRLGIRVRVNIGVAYDTDLQKAKQTILGVADSVDWISKSPSPKVVVRNFGESSVDLQLRVWIEDARKRMDTISAITDQVKSAFDAAGIEIPYPRRDLHITRVVQHPAPRGAVSAPPGNPHSPMNTLGEVE